MKPINKRLRLGYVKSIDTAAKKVVAHVSTYQWDRMNERFQKGAWDLQDYLLNPVVLWSHDASEPPIGKATTVQEDELGLISETLFDEGNERSMEIFGLYERGFLNAFSVGFMPKKWAFEGIEGTQDRGLVYQEASLLEYSAVSIPANPGAVISRELGELVQKSLGDTFITAAPGGFIVSPFEYKEGPAFDPDKEIEKTSAPAPLEALNQCLEILKVARGSKLDKTVLQGLAQASTLFQEIVQENSDFVDVDDFKRLESSVSQLGDVVKNLFPDASETVRRIMSQVEKAVKGRAS